VSAEKKIQRSLRMLGALRSAIESNDVEFVKRTLAMRTWPANFLSYGLLTASSTTHGNSKIIEMLLDAKADPSESGLDTASQHNHVETVRLMLKCKADVHEKNDRPCD